jgi:uncharacterized membrane protein YhhN
VINFHQVQWATWLVLIGFLLDWVAIFFQWKIIKIVSKPLVMILIILWTLNTAGWQLNPLLWILLFGQLFGLIGDIFLQLSRKWFLPGLGAFLIGHICYLVLFSINLIEIFKSGNQDPYWGWWVMIGLLVFLGLMTVFNRSFSPISKRRTTKPFLWMAIRVYAGVLSLIVVTAFLLTSLISSRSFTLWLLPAGAVLFLISDFLLAYRKFIRTFPHAQLIVRITYHLAQFCLAYGFLSVII